MPFWLAAVGSLIVGTLFGAIMELVVIRRLFYAPRVIVLGRDHRDRRARAGDHHRVSRRSTTRVPPYPVAVDKTWDDVAGRAASPGAQLADARRRARSSRSRSAGSSTARTLGRTVEGVGREPRPRAGARASTPRSSPPLVWAIAGFARHDHDDAGRPARRRSRPGNLQTLGPNTLARALVAAVIAGMVSFPRAMLAGVVDRCGAGADPLQLPRQARAGRRLPARSRC